MIETRNVDCRGMQCPAPVLHIAKNAREVSSKPAILNIFADDADFPADLEAWCRTAKAKLKWDAEEADGAYHAVVALNGAAFEGETPAPAAAPPAAAPPAPAPAYSSPPAPHAAPPPPAPASGAAVVDLCGKEPHIAILHLSTALLGAGGEVDVISDHPTFEQALYTWSAATRSVVSNVQRRGNRVTVRVGLPPEARTSAPPAPAPAAQQQLIPITGGDPDLPRENRATFLLIHNDLENVLSCLLSANAAAAQSMTVCIFFSFWGVNVLRAERPRAGGARAGFLRSMMKMMMPKGPDRQKLGKMHMGGMGTGLMKKFMRQKNILSVRQLLMQAVELDATFRVCTMSMGIMGIDKADLMDLPNIEYAGVTACMESARRSAISMVF